LESEFALDDLILGSGALHRSSLLGYLRQTLRVESSWPDKKSRTWQEPAGLPCQSSSRLNSQPPTTVVVVVTHPHFNALLVKEPPSGDEWLHELKFDGYRMLCRIDRGHVTVWSRNGKDWTEKFLNVIEAVKSLKVTSAIICENSAQSRCRMLVGTGAKLRRTCSVRI
jgi:ATP-dependent DNA ligase